MNALVEKYVLRKNAGGLYKRKGIINGSPSNPSMVLGIRDSALDLYCPIHAVQESG